MKSTASEYATRTQALRHVKCNLRENSGLISRGFSQLRGDRFACRSSTRCFSFSAAMSPPFPFGRENFDELSRQSLGERRVLLVDDEPESLYLFARMLVNAGIRNQIDVADGGEEAVAYLQRCLAGEYPWPQAVFLDIKMPVMDGFGVLKWARDHGVLTKTVVVMLTSSEEPEDAATAFQLGAHYYIPKEAKHDRLNELLGEVMKRGTPADTDKAAG